MAGAIAAHLLRDQSAATVDTAGVYAGSGSPASPEAVTVMNERDLDLSAHGSRPVTAEAIAAADVIYAMTQAHVDALVQAFPEAAQKTKRLDADADVSDPIGGSMDHYRQAADQIEAALRRRFADFEGDPA